MRWGFHMVIQGDDKQREKVIQSLWYIGHMWDPGRNREDEKKWLQSERGRAEGSLLWFILLSFRACVAENKIGSVDHITLYPLQIFTSPRLDQWQNVYIYQLPSTIWRHVFLRVFLSFANQGKFAHFNTPHELDALLSYRVHWAKKIFDWKSVASSTIMQNDSYLTLEVLSVTWKAWCIQADSGM